MRTLLTLLRKDIASFTRNRTAVSLTFIVPIALIYIFGQVFGLNRTDSGPSGIRIGVVNESTNPAAAKLVDALRAEKSFRVVSDFDLPDKKTRPLTEADARQLIHDHAFNFAVVIPADLIATDHIGLHLKILSNPRNEIETQTVTGLLQKTLFSNVPELLGQSLQNRARNFLGDDRMKKFNRAIANSVVEAFGGDRAKIEADLENGDYGLSHLTHRESVTNDPTLRRLDAPASGIPAPNSGAATAGAVASKGDSTAATTAAAAPKANAASDVFSRVVKIETEQVVGKDVKSPEATRIVGGWAIMFLLFAISGSSAAFFDEKNTGIFQRLLSAPVTRAQLLFSRFVFGILLGLVQLTTLFIAGHLLYGIDVFAHFGNLVVVCVFAAAACTSFGMIIAAFAPNATAANGLATFIVLIMSATGGAWFPISFMPEFMQKVGKLTVVYWSMEGFNRVLWAGSGLSDLWSILGILLGITTVVMSVAVWRLNRRKIFE